MDGSARSSASRCAVCIADAGAIVVFVALLVLGAAAHHRLDVASAHVADRPRRCSDGHRRSAPGRSARSAFGDIATLKSERDGDGDEADGYDPYDEELDGGRPSLYDADADDDWSDVAPAKPKRARAKPTVDPGCSPSAMPNRPSSTSGPGAQKGAWVLPPFTT